MKLYTRRDYINHSFLHKIEPDVLVMLCFAAKPNHNDNGIRHHWILILGEDK